MSTASTEPQKNEEGRGRRIAALTLLTCTAIAALAVWAVFVQTNDARRMASPESIAAIQEEIAPHLRDDDLVRVLPLWFHSGRRGLNEVRLLQSDDLDEWELALSERLWLLWSRSHDEDARREAASLHNFEIVAENEEFAAGVGEIPQQSEVHWDATSTFWDAEVMRAGAHSRRGRPCTRRMDGQLHCGGYNRWTYASPGYRETDDTVRRCIRVNAFPNGERWIFRWSDVELGERVELQYGNSFEAVRNRRGAPVHTELRIDDELVFAEETPVDAIGFPLVSHDTSERAGERADLQISIRADNHLDRFFCFRARTVSSTGGE